MNNISPCVIIMCIKQLSVPPPHFPLPSPMEEWVQYTLDSTQRQCSEPPIKPLPPFPPASHPTRLLVKLVHKYEKYTSLDQSGFDTLRGVFPPSSQPGHGRHCGHSSQGHRGWKDNLCVPSLYTTNKALIGMSVCLSYSVWGRDDGNDDHHFNEKTMRS